MIRTVQQINFDILGIYMKIFERIFYGVCDSIAT